MVSLEFFPQRVLGTIMPNLHPFAREIKRHPEAMEKRMIRFAEMAVILSSATPPRT